MQEAFKLGHDKQKYECVKIWPVDKENTLIGQGWFFNNLISLVELDEQDHLRTNRGRDLNSTQDILEV